MNRQQQDSQVIRAMFFQLSERDRRMKWYQNRLEIAVKSLIKIGKELGVPQPGYPAPVANAADLVNEALERIEKEPMPKE